MKTHNAIEQEINRIRLDIFEETKGMTVDQRVERWDRIADDAAKKYGLKIAEGAKGGRARPLEP